MTVALDRHTSCSLCSLPLRPFYMNLDEMVYMCPNPACIFPLDSEDLSSYIVCETVDKSHNGVIGELSQEPFFAEMFGVDSSGAAHSSSQVSSRVITPPFSSVSASSIHDEEYTYVSTLNSAITLVLCVRYFESFHKELDNSLIASLFDALKATSNGDEASSIAPNLVNIVSEKISVNPSSNISIPARINLVINRLLRDSSLAQQAMRIESKTSEFCESCGFCRTWTSQTSSLQLRSYKSHSNMTKVIATEECTECGSHDKSLQTTFSKMSDVFTIYCHEKASQFITNAETKPFTDFTFSQDNEESNYVLTTVIKYDEHVRRLVVLVRKDSKQPILDVKNWLRFDSLEAFVAGRFTNPPDTEWLTSLPLFLVWQRMNNKPWVLFDSPIISSLHSLGNSISNASLPLPTKLSSKVTRSFASNSSSVSGVSTFSRKRLEGDFFLSPPTSGPVKRFISDRPSSMASTTTMTNSQFLQKSLERLSSHRKILDRKPGSRTTSVSSSSRMSSSRHSSPTTNGSISSPVSSNGAKKSRLDVSESDDLLDSFLR